MGRRKKCDSQKQNIFKVESKTKTIEKKKRSFNIDKRIFKAKDKIGKLTGYLFIFEFNGNYCLTLKHEVKEKDKFKPLMSSDNLEMIKQIGSALSEELKFPYESNPQQKSQTKKKKVNKKEQEIDHSIFKEFNGNLYVYLTFGSIMLGHNKYHIKRNYDKIDGYKIFELKSNIAFNKCKDLLMTFDETLKEKLLKDAMKLGDFESKNTLRMVFGMKSLKVTCLRDGKIIQTESDKIENEEDILI